MPQGLPERQAFPDLQDGEPIPEALHLHCPSCGYELTGLTSRRCPECGEPFDPREAWLAGRRGNWHDHFETVRAPADYAVWALATTFVAVFLLAPGGSTVWLAPGIVFVGETLLAVAGTHKTHGRLVHLSLAIAWTVVCWLRA